MGIKQAAKRRLGFEMGYNSEVSDFKLIEKILYRADCADGKFEEFERKYIFYLLKLNKK